MSKNVIFGINGPVVTVDGTKDFSMHLEQDDGRLIYEGKIVYEQMEYEFEIDAGTGDFISWEQESVFD